MSSQSTRKEPGALRVAVLLDIENILIGDRRRVGLAEAAAMLDDIAARVSGLPVRVAGGRGVIKPYAGLLARRGWGLSLVPTLPDAADLCLIDSGRDFVDTGITDLVVISGDHAFSVLAAHARLHVIAHPHKLSRRLRLASTTITLLAAPSQRPWLAA